MGSQKLPPNLQSWVDARNRHHLSHAHVQMARELGLNPRKLGKIDNHGQEPWKLPLPVFIEELYLDRFGRERPAVVLSIEDRFKAHRRRKRERKAARAAVRAAEAAADVGIVIDWDDPSALPDSGEAEQECPF
jgi:hypothetical protein